MPDEYPLGRTSAEYDRVRWQARLWQDATASVLDRAGLRPGMRCLDLGSGPGEVMRLLAGRVGPSGAVTGVDNDARIGEQAMEMLRAGGGARREFVHADISEVAELPGAPFDLVIARLLLIHLRDPIAMLRKMYDWTVPGGVVVVQDYDASPMDIQPRLASWHEFERVGFGITQKLGRDVRFGQKLPLHFAAAGLGQPDGTDVAGLLLPLAEIGPWFHAVYQSLRPAAIRLGVTTEAAGQAFLAELAEATEADRGIGMTPLLVSAWKRKPATQVAG